MTGVKNTEFVDETQSEKISRRVEEGLVSHRNSPDRIFLIQAGPFSIGSHIKSNNIEPRWDPFASGSGASPLQSVRSGARFPLFCQTTNKTSIKVLNVG